MNLSDILDQQEESRSERAEILGTFLEPGLQPWCRVCGRPVARHHLERLGGDVVFDVECHGERMTGALPRRMPWFRFRLEVFCADEPHMECVPVWWVTLDGGEVQPSDAHFAAVAASGRVFNGPFGRWCRDWGIVLLPVVLAAFGLLVRLGHR